MTDANKLANMKKKTLDILTLKTCLMCYYNYIIYYFTDQNIVIQTQKINTEFRTIPKLHHSIFFLLHIHITEYKHST